MSMPGLSAPTHRGEPRAQSGRRARRGHTAMAVLALLSEQDMHGYQIIQQIGERTGGAWSPSPGSVYPALQQLEEKGFLLSEADGDKRVFSLTELGRKHALALPGSPWDDFADADAPTAKLRQAVTGLMEAVHQVGRAGSPEQMEQTSLLLDETRRRVYRILAGDE
jgi:DNA-binding PadR family transcriptional regulator